MKVLVVALGLALGSGAALAGQESFDLRVAGLKVGVVQLAATETATRYELRATIRSTGLAAAIRHFSYRGATKGRVRGGRLVPERYEEAADTGRRSSSALMTYTDGVPRLVEYSSPREAGPDAPSPASQGGTLDPLSAVYAMLRDIPADQACTLSMFIFDGKRRGRIRLSPAGEANGLPTCTGSYDRLEGFTAEEVKRHRSFPLRVTYSALGDGRLRVARVAFKSLYGQAVIDRR